MQEVLYAIINNRVDTDVLFPTDPVRDDFCNLVYLDIRATVDYIANEVTTNLDDPSDTEVVKNYATQWLLNQGLQPLPVDQLNQQAAVRYKLDGLQIENYKGIGANFNPLVGLSAFDLILFRAING